MSKTKQLAKVELTKADLNKLIEDAIERGRSEEEKQKRDYYRETEKLLYNYPNLQAKVESDEEFLFNPDAIATPKKNRSKDIIIYSTKGNGSHGLDIDRYTQGVKSSMMRTRAEVERIERALKVIADDDYFEIIPMKYFKGMTFREIADEFNCEEKTIGRNRTRIIQRLMVLLFGADALSI